MGPLEQSSTIVVKTSCSLFTSINISFHNGYFPEDDVHDLEDNAHMLKRIVGSLVEGNVNGLWDLKGWRAALDDPSTKFTLTAFKRERKQCVRDAESWFSREIIAYFENHG